jgi:hypothetical protein
MIENESIRDYSNKQNANEYRLRGEEMYPDLTPEQQTEAEYYLTRYFEIVHSIFEEKYDLTGSDLNATFKHEK